MRVQVRGSWACTEEGPLDGQEGLGTDASGRVWDLGAGLRERVQVLRD